MSYRNLEVWQIARELSISVHKMTLNELPKFEMFEEGSQIRRSSKSVRSNIVEGYGRRKYTMDYIKHLTYAQASNDETIDHLETLYETESLKNEKLYSDLNQRLNTLGKKLNKFISVIESSTRNKKPAARNKQPVTETSNR
jgi:four helix bundle protein